MDMDVDKARCNLIPRPHQFQWIIKSLCFVRLPQNLITCNDHRSLDHPLRRYNLPVNYFSSLKHVSLDCDEFVKKNNKAYSRCVRAWDYQLRRR